MHSEQHMLLLLLLLLLYTYIFSQTVESLYFWISFCCYICYTGLSIYAYLKPYENTTIDLAFFSQKYEQIVRSFDRLENVLINIGNGLMHFMPCGHRAIGTKKLYSFFHSFFVSISCLRPISRALSVAILCYMQIALVKFNNQ